jgi:hypothetical protein
MGMFDTLPQNFTDHFKEGEVFLLQKAEVVTIPTGEYGNQDAVTMTIDGERYSVFGAGLVGQIGRMSKDDLPTRVSVQRAKSKKGSVKVFVPEGKSLVDLGMEPMPQSKSDAPVNDDDFKGTGGPADDDIPF